MAWSDRKRRIARILWASCWSEAAIAACLSVSVRTLVAATRRWRRAENAEFLVADLVRALALRDGVRETSLAAAYQQLNNRGFRDGLERRS